MILFRLEERQFVVFQFSRALSLLVELILFLSHTLSL